MTSRSVPPTIPLVKPGTPPGEWSESLLESSPGSDIPAIFSEVKGRKPSREITEETRPEELHVSREKQESQTSNEPKRPTTRDQPSIGTTAVQTAKQYVPKPVGKAVNYATPTAAAVASYLPDPQGIKASGEYREEPRISLPSTELKGALPAEHTDGVGALPGNLSESSVALLPDERQERADQEHRPASPRQRRDTIKPTAEGGDDEPRKSEKEETKMAPSRDEPAASQLSDAIPQNTQASGGESVESDTAVSPVPEVKLQGEANEAKRRQPLGEQVGVATVAAIGMVGTASGAEELGEKPEVEEDIEGSNLTSEKLGEAKDPSQDVQEEGNKEEGTTTAKIEAGYSGEYHPAQLHPPPPGASVAEYQSSFGTQQEGQESPTTRTAKRASMGAEKKPGFMTMVKGEMKILAGKMSGDEHKVEEGKKIIHREM